VNFDKKKKTLKLTFVLVLLLLFITACKTEYYIFRSGNASNVTVSGSNYTNGTGLDLIVNEFSINPSYRLPQICSNGQGNIWNSTSSSWECGSAGGSGSVTSIVAGFGLNRTTITTTGTINVNLSEIQARVSSSCAADSSIRIINQDGTVTCETDSGITTETDPIASPIALEANSTANLANNSANILNLTKLNITDQRFNESGGVASLNLTKLNVTDQRFNESGGVASLNLTKLNITDQRFNETNAMLANLSLKFNITGGNITGNINMTRKNITDVSNIYLNVTRWYSGACEYDNGTAILFRSPCDI
jgi:hypothetical protein